MSALPSVQPWRLPLRPWQTQAIGKWLQRRAPDALWVATPGSGKTIAAARLAAGLVRGAAVERVIVVVPRVHLKRQTARTYGAASFPMEYRWSGGEWPADARGVAVTYQQVAAHPEGFARLAGDALVVMDEVHHAGESASWGQALRTAFSGARYRLLLSGTPMRTDGTAIPFVRYGGDGAYVADTVYGYDDAVADAVCRPTRFLVVDGDARWQSADGTHKHGSFAAGTLSARGQRELLRTQLELGMEPVIMRANATLQRVRATHPDAAALVVARDQEHARQLASLIQGISGQRPSLVISDEEGADRQLEAFAAGHGSWIVAVHMVSEGVDIPRLRVGVFASSVTTDLYLRQFVGRFVRTQKGSPAGASHIYVPGHPQIVANARLIRTEALSRLAEVSQSESDPPTGGAPPPERSVLVPSSYRPLAASLGVVDEMAHEAPQTTGAAGHVGDASDLSHGYGKGNIIGDEKGELRSRVADLVRRLSRVTGKEQREIHRLLGRRCGDRIAEATLWTLQSRVAILERWLASVTQVS